MPQIKFKWETWDEFWPDGRALAQEEFDEYRDVLRLTYPHCMDEERLKGLPLEVFGFAVARVNGAPKGYFGLSFEPDLESAGRIIAKQGPWYVPRGAMRLGLAKILWDMALARARAHANVFELHHPPYGRGKRLESFFKSLGAKPMKISYYLELGDDSNA